MKRTLAQFAQACGGALAGADAPYTDVVSDSRTLTGGQLFVALRGPHFNGHDFLAAALAAGAAGAVVDAAQPLALPQIVVSDTQAALERAALAWRAAFRGPLVGVAGSNGKTTAKEMLAAILAQAGSCLATRGNLNNHIGVPLTLLRLTPTHRFAVIEMGANHPGEVAALAQLARPTVGMITNAGAEHLEGFGSLEGVARAEGELVAGLAPAANTEYAVEMRSVMGVSLPLVTMRVEPLPFPYSPSGISAAFDELRTKWIEAGRILGAWTELSGSVWKVAAELEQTQRRVKALENLLIPKYQAAIRRIQTILEEQERETFIRAKRAKERRQEVAEPQTEPGCPLGPSGSRL